MRWQGGNENSSVPEDNVGKELGQDKDESRRIANWLVGDGLLKRGPIGKIHLTHEGIKEKEKEETKGR